MTAAFEYTEYGVLADAGPHRGMLIKTFRSIEAAREFVDLPERVQEKFVIRQRRVTKSDWYPVYEVTP
jgi:hypothetical protein